VLVQAARLHQVKLTEFMIKPAQVAAEMALADRSRFVLPAGKWRGFYPRLGCPAPGDTGAAQAIQRTFGLRLRMSFTRPAFGRVLHAPWWSPRFPA